jgi:hypothetical protein
MRRPAPGGVRQSTGITTSSTNAPHARPQTEGITMTNDRRRKKAIRARMAETGQNYTAAMRDLERIESTEPVELPPLGPKWGPEYQSRQQQRYQPPQCPHGTDDVERCAEGGHDT